MLLWTIMQAVADIREFDDCITIYRFGWRTVDRGRVLPGGPAPLSLPHITTPTLCVKVYVRVCMVGFGGSRWSCSWKALRLGCAREMTISPWRVWVWVCVGGGLG
ncbi:hypothetical protein Vretimale_11628 [Volvox reticuliferus]|uniref:Uncharacterized protein n=1 Tax=Volvox reticuliferus TaxID=1737510 RepID=A0A8J4CQE3_9CHLO|nr:hypothetical protein Vretifemale_14763 [Volvox reticuliferus]GIM07554.1 hypothetical protein Vretimale_11628 [Volvox reticuliferus]